MRSHTSAKSKNWGLEFQMKSGINNWMYVCLILSNLKKSYGVSSQHMESLKVEILDK